MCTTAPASCTELRRTRIHHGHGLSMCTNTDPSVLHHANHSGPLHTPPPKCISTAYRDPSQSPFSTALVNDQRPEDQYEAWLGIGVNEVHRVYLVTGYTNKEPWIDMDVAMVARETFQLQNRIAWVMSIHTDVASSSQRTSICSTLPRMETARWACRTPSRATRTAMVPSFGTATTCGMCYMSRRPTYPTALVTQKRSVDSWPRCASALPPKFKSRAPCCSTRPPATRACTMWGPRFKFARSGPRLPART